VHALGIVGFEENSVTQVEAKKPALALYEMGA
jgi:hypothetical protein